MTKVRLYCETVEGIAYTSFPADERRAEEMALAVLGTEARRGGIICLAHVQKSTDAGEWVTVGEWEY